MYMNRVAGFYLGSNIWKQGIETMTIEERNEKVNETLDSRYDQLNETIEQAEQMLKAMRLSGDTEHMYAKWSEPDEQYDLHTYAYIGMTKVNGAWRLCHGYADDYRPYVSEWKPLRDCTIQERLRAIQDLDKLREKIIEEKEKTIPKVETAISKMTDMLGRWQQGSARKDM